MKPFFSGLVRNRVPILTHRQLQDVEANKPVDVWEAVEVCVCARLRVMCRDTLKKDPHRLLTQLAQLTCMFDL